LLLLVIRQVLENISHYPELFFFFDTKVQKNIVPLQHKT